MIDAAGTVTIFGGDGCRGAHDTVVALCEKLIGHYVQRVPETRPIRPEYLVSVINEVAGDDAAFFADTGTACIWMARYVDARAGRHLFGSLSWASMANSMPNAMGAALAFPGR